MSASLFRGGSVIPHTMVLNQTSFVGSVPAKLSGNFQVRGTVTATPAAGYTNVTYQWKANGTAIPGATSSSYTIDKAYADMVITCDVMGTYPAAGTPARANVPLMPTISGITAGDGSVTVTFTRNADNGGSAATSDRTDIFRASDNVLVAQSTATSPALITGLTNGQAVYAQSVTFNNAGPSDPSAVSATVTPAAAVRPLRIASVENRIATTSSGQAGMKDYVFRLRLIPAVDLSEIVLNMYNFHMGTGGTGGPSNTITIESAVVEGPSIAARATYQGASSFTMAQASGDYNMDVITAASVGLTKFVAGQVYWVKGRLSVPATGNSVPLADHFVLLTPGERFTWYDPAVTTLGNEFGVGNFTLTGGTPSEKGTGFCPVILGRAFDGGDLVSLITIGDSNAGGTGDDSKSATQPGNGFVQRACSDGPTLVNQFNMSRLNSTISTWQGVNAALPRAYLKYATMFNGKVGGNDVPDDGSASATTVNNFKSNFQNLITQVKAAGITKIMFGQIFTRSDSSDNWTTTANQTVKPGREAGGVVDQINAWIATKVNDGTATSINKYIEFTSQRDATLPYLWNVTGADGVTPGTTNTVEGTHLNPLAHLKASVTQRAAIYELMN